MDSVEKTSHLNKTDGVDTINDGKINSRVLSILNNDFADSVSVKYTEKKLKELIDKKGGLQSLSGVSSILLEMLTKRPEFITMMGQATDDNYLINYLSQIKPQSEYYAKVIQEITSICEQNTNLKVADNPAWFSLKSINSSNSNTGVNYKIYSTIGVNGYDFISKIYQLSTRLNELSIRTNDKISLKVSRTMLGFLSHNDSIVIHFKNRKNKDEIEKILEEWKNNNGIIEESRNLGRTKFALDSKKTSFSNLIADNVAKWFSENYGKYDTELLIKLAIGYAIKQSQDIPNLVND